MSCRGYRRNEIIQGLIVRINVRDCVYHDIKPMIKEYDYLFKFVIVGNQGAGKSSLFIRFSDDTFVENYLATIGVDFRFKTLEVDNLQCKLQIWDTAGQERFRTITSAYYKGSHAVIIVYDINNLDTFQEIEGYWMNEVKTNADKDIQIVLVGTKSDLERHVPQETVSSLT
jgi:Ras-related protein Rab-1A